MNDVEERGQAIDSCSSRAKAAARSKRNPSTCISGPSNADCPSSAAERGCRMLKVLPHPV